MNSYNPDPNHETVEDSNARLTEGEVAFWVMTAVVVIAVVVAIIAVVLYVMHNIL